MKANEHRETKFLLKAFARRCSVIDATLKFREMFGKDPTPMQIALTNLGGFDSDKRAYFDPDKNWRMKFFKRERQKYEASVDACDISSLKWRMDRYQELYERADRRSKETGNPSRCMDILVLAAKDVSGAYLPKQQTVNVDNRTVNVNMSNEEIDKKLRTLLGQFGVSLEGTALIERGANVIEGESE